MNTKSIILYHSGAGSTRTVAEIYYALLSSTHDITMKSLADVTDYNVLLGYDTLILGFPTYHCEPSRSMLEFIRDMPVMTPEKTAYVFTTYGLYPGNSLRILINLASSKNIKCCGYSGYRTPATDGALLIPPLAFMFDYQANIGAKISSDLKIIRSILDGDTNRAVKPRFKWYTVLNYPNKLMGKSYKHTIMIQDELCNGCQLCVKECTRRCLQG